jgi:hypothetical protein
MNDITTTKTTATTTITTTRTITNSNRDGDHVIVLRPVSRGGLIGGNKWRQALLAARELLRRLYQNTCGASRSFSPVPTVRRKMPPSRACARKRKHTGAHKRASHIDKRATDSFAGGARELIR